MASVLPSDILRDVCHWLPQNDLLHFALTCKAAYDVALPEIYHSIVIDSSKRVYHETAAANRVASFVRTTDLVGEPVVIRSLYAFTRFLKVLAANPRYAAWLRVLVVQDKIPDIPHYELGQLLHRVLPLLSNLHVLNWYSQQLPLNTEHLALLPNPRNLVSLCGNFQFVGLLKSIPLHLPYLRHLDISNFALEKFLKAIDLDGYPTLETLTISRSASPNCLVHSSLEGVQSEGIENLPAGQHPAFILTLFAKPLNIPLHIHSLVLRDIIVSASDAQRLLQSIHAPTLTELSLDNCSEALFTETPGFSRAVNRRNPPASMFLDVITSQLTNLSLLSLNLSNELCFNTTTFNAISRLSNLSKLTVHIKVFQSNDPINLAPLVNALQSHAATLEYLSICCEVVEQTSAPICPRNGNRFELKSMLGLSNLYRLKVLRLPLTFAQLSYLPDTLSQLQSLKVMQLLVTDSATASACNNCNDTLIYALYNTNCLISQDYFNCPSSFTSTIEDIKNQQYADITKTYRDVFRDLAYLRFDLKNQSLLYDCENPEKIELKDSILIERFDSLVHQWV